MIVDDVLADVLQKLKDAPEDKGSAAGLRYPENSGHQRGFDFKETT